MTTPEAHPHYWNIWWTLTVISAAFTIIVLLLEGFGIFDDWGLVLSGIGLVLTVVGSATAATRTAVTGIDRRLDQLHDTLKHMLRILDQRLPDRPRI